jgi:protocatechuate 3,4-dioxygenase beta subunit
MSPASAGSAANPNVDWASGGTKSMSGPYPDPFAMGNAGTACQLYPAQTLGPCYSSGPEMREDISDGATGLPTRLSFLVIRSSDCTPIPGATVDIWHSGFDGVYSAFGFGICNPSGLNVANEMFCRGVQTTDERGRVDFLTIFPGWYSGRAVHIHFTVRASGMGQATSQLYFDDDLTTEIQAQGEYAARGMRNTTNAQDGVFRSGGASAEEVVFKTAKLADGSLHAWKVLAV